MHLGFSPDPESNIICRFKIHGMTVDVMPTEPEAIIGFSNRWYPGGFRWAETSIIEDTTVRIFSLPYL